MKLALALLLALLVIVLVVQLDPDSAADAVTVTGLDGAGEVARTDADLEVAGDDAPGRAEVSTEDREEAAAPSPAADLASEVGVLELLVVDDDLLGVAQAHVILDLEQVIEEHAVGEQPAHGIQRPLQAQTDAEGRARLEVPPARKGSLRVLLLSGVGHMLPRDFEPLQAGETRSITLVLRTKADREVTGVVLAAELGTPIPSIQVHATPWRGTHRSRAPMPLAIDGPPTTITDGAGEFSVPAYSWAASTATFSGSGWSPMSVRLGDQGEGVVVRLRRSGRLVGCVTCSKPGVLTVRAITPGHNLIEGPDAVSMSPGEVCFDTQVGVDGAFQLEDLPSRVPLELQVLRSGKLAYEHADMLTIEPDGTQHFEWNLGRGGAISGHVHHPTGTPAVDQEIWLVPAAQASGTMLSIHDQARTRVRSDEHGAYRFDDVQPGSWAVGLRPARERDATVAPMARQVQVPLEGGEVQVDLVVHQGLFLEGQVLDPAGEPTRAYVMTFGGPNSVSHDIDDPQQGFRLGPLVPGSYRLFAMPSSSSELTGAEPITATVTEEGGESGLVLQLRQGSSISGRILGSDGEEVRARAYLMQPKDRLTATSPQDGEFEFDGIPAGTHHLSVISEDGRVGWLEGIVVEAGNPRDDLEVVVEPGAWVTLLYKGEKTHVSYRIRRGSLVFASDGLRTGTEARMCVPVGHLELLVDGEPRELVTHAEQETVVEL
ncbi:MAG: carboxypeptidase-like regulatory domain-containing protein [Planctomycetota bacterium]|nr:carboxypeptidase-like regulatory domain-containing protein [Planctomycetota bacterium]